MKVKSKYITVRFQVDERLEVNDLYEALCVGAYEDLGALGTLHDRFEPCGFIDIEILAFESGPEVDTQPTDEEREAIEAAVRLLGKDNNKDRKH